MKTTARCYYMQGLEVPLSKQPVVSEFYFSEHRSQFILLVCPSIRTSKKKPFRKYTSFVLEIDAQIVFNTRRKADEKKVEIKNQRKKLVRIGLKCVRKKLCYNVKNRCNFYCRLIHAMSHKL